MFWCAAVADKYAKTVYQKSPFLFPRTSLCASSPILYFSMAVPNLQPSPVFFFFSFLPPSTHTEQIINSPPCVSSGHTLGWPCLGSLNLPSSPYPQSRTSAHRNAGTAATLYVVSWTFRAPPGWGWHGDAMRCGRIREVLIDGGSWTQQPRMFGRSDIRSCSRGTRIT